MAEKVKEELEINNFLSIKHLKWEFSEFNIISGGVAAGKSLCIKLLKYIEDIIPNLLALPYDRFIRNLNTAYFFDNLTNRFNDIFYLSAAKRQPCEFIINYKLSCGEEIFDVTIKGSNHSNIVFKSSFLEILLPDLRELLQKYISDNVTLDGFREVKHIFYDKLQKKFNDYWPLRTAFIPASRATLALTSSFNDDYLKNYKDLTDVLFTREGRAERWSIPILKAKLITEDTIYLESDDGRRIPLEMASDAQQESAYILMHLYRLGFRFYTYSRRHSIFIEEPSAYLFPPEQKKIIEFIVRTYNLLRDSPSHARFFITTCNSYVLDSLNNMLLKGKLLIEYKDKKVPKDERIKKIKIPALLPEEFSAYQINDEGVGENMLNKEGQLVQPSMFKKTSAAIKKDAKTLSGLYDEFLRQDDPL
jgi:hypothetical protein